MSDIYNLVQKELARGRGAKSQYQDPLTDMIMKMPEIIANNQEKENQKFLNQNRVANNLASTIQRYIVASSNQDGTISNQNISNVMDKIKESQFSFSKQFPDAIESIDAIADMHLNDLENIRQDNVNYSNISNAVSAMFSPSDDATFTALAKKYENLTEGDVLQNKDELMKELALVSKNINDYSSQISEKGYNQRTGSGVILNNLGKGKLLVKAFTQQLLDSDEMSSNKILTNAEKSALNSYIQNDDVAQLGLIMDAQQQKIDGQAKQLKSKIENNVKSYQDAEMKLNSSPEAQEALKEYLALPEGSDEREFSSIAIGDEQYRVKDLLEQKLAASNELIGLDDRFKNFNPSGFSYIDLHGDSDVGSMINSSSELKKLFGLKSKKLPSNLVEPNQNQDNNIVNQNQDNNIVNQQDSVEPNMEIVDNVMNLSLSNPASTAPNRKEFENATKELSGRQKSLLKQAYRENINLKKMVQRSNAYLDSVQKNITSQELPPKIKSKMQRFQKEEERLLNKYNKTIEKYKNSFKGKKVSQKEDKQDVKNPYSYKMI